MRVDSVSNSIVNRKFKHTRHQVLMTRDSRLSKKDIRILARYKALKLFYREKHRKLDISNWDYPSKFPTVQDFLLHRDQLKEKELFYQEKYKSYLSQITDVGNLVQTVDFDSSSLCLKH